MVYIVNECIALWNQITQKLFKNYSVHTKQFSSITYSDTLERRLWKSTNFKMR